MSGDIESVEGQGMIHTDPDSPLAVMITNVSIDKHAGEMQTGRVLWWNHRKGSEIYFVVHMEKLESNQLEFTWVQNV